MTRTAALYTRISDDPNGHAAGVARQEKDCRERAERLGWTVAAVYTENDVSAFKRKIVRLPDGRKGPRVIRPQFRAMLDDLADGTVDALVVYDLDRLARDPRDLEDIIDAVEMHGVQVTSVTGSLELSNDGGRAMARVLCAMANKSSADTARRVARKQADMAAAGLPSGGGRRAYGYDPTGMVVIEAEAQVIREAAAAIIDGATQQAVADDLNERGVPSTYGGPWSPRSVRSVVTKARNAGLREHHGEVVGKAAWPAILDEETLHDVRAALAGRPKGSNTFKRWLTGVLICSRCGEALIGWTGPRGPKYWCVPAKSRATANGCGKLSILAEPTEEYVTAMVLAVLTRKDNLAALSAGIGTARLDAVRAEVRADEELLAEMAQAYGNRAFTLAEYLAARKPVEERIKAAKAVLSAHAPAVLRRISTGDVAANFTALGAQDKRDVVRVVFPDGLQIAPGTRGRGRYDGDRISIRSAG